MTMNDEQKIYAFIDSQNLNLAIKDCGWDLDYARFFVYLKDKYKVKKTFLFIGYVAGNEALYTFLQKAGYIIIFKPTLEYKTNGQKFTKGNVDAELVLHSMIEYLQKHGKLLHLLIPNRKRYSALLRKFRRYFIYIDNLSNKLGKKKRE